MPRTVGGILVVAMPTSCIAALVSLRCRLQDCRAFNDEDAIVPVARSQRQSSCGNRARGADRAITSAIDAHVEAERDRVDDGDDGQGGAPVPTS
jgi:hypothetical protein